MFSLINKISILLLLGLFFLNLSGCDSNVIDKVTIKVSLEDRNELLKAEFKVKVEDEIIASKAGEIVEFLVEPGEITIIASYQGQELEKEVIVEDEQRIKFYFEEDEEIRLEPEFRDVTVHDPMITEVNGSYYVFGSHLASAKTDDLIAWEQLSTGWSVHNPIIPNPDQELEEALAWPEASEDWQDPESSPSTWAKSVIETDSKYHMYFSTSGWGYTRSAISLATSNNVDGPYEYQEMVVKSYNPDEINREGVENDPNIHPNAIDPHVFRDAEDNLWMLYGSYAGGIYLLELNENGRPKPEQGYGEKISGGNHAAMEGPYILYHPETEYYYLMLSFGTLATDGGYNIRIARSKNPEGPYYDHNDQDMKGANSRDYSEIQPYGVKAIGNFEFVESGLSYLSPGHNSAYYDENTGKTYAIFHTRFPNRGEAHEVRVHQMLINQKGWPVIMPHRYGGETVSSYSSEEVAGVYQYLNHGRAITAEVSQSSNIELRADGSISGVVDGSWKLTGDYTVDLTIEGQTYQGVFLEQWDDGLKEYVMAFSALSEAGVTVWGSQLVE